MAIIGGPSVPTVLPVGLIKVPTPCLPRGFQIKCSSCRCSVTPTHVPGSQDCDEARVEREWSMADD